jgi:hypothetical protein
MAKTKKLGDLVNQTISTNAPLSGGGALTGTLNFSITKANTTTDGYVSKEDWNFFNNKQDALGFTPYNATNPDGYITSSALTSYVPYTGATADVDLGTHSLTASDLIIDHASGSGVAASITKGGNGEALTVVKSSGSGNVASFTGGNTFISTLTTPTINGVSGNLAFANAVQTSGAVTAFTFTKPNNTTQTASTQINGFVVNGGTRQWATGNIGTQSENVWGATTYSFVGASTITNAYGNVFNAPIAGTNCTITNNYAAQFNGNVQINGIVDRIAINYPSLPAIYKLGVGGKMVVNGDIVIQDDSGNFAAYSSDGTIQSGGFSFNRYVGVNIYSSNTNPIKLSVNGTENFRMFNGGNILIQNGGTFTNAGFRLDVNGTARFQGNVSLTQTVTTETVTQTRTVTIVINGTTYKLLAA